ncbi:serine hydrolase [Erythrobacter sp. F6033]|uniref:serine hydrolase domain-containing protein n=1 Tax=Erythrobacter sp. F6033 TaxID=2926401 RepID=UPI001FF461E8|nr:serine hydrolase [Erythrobacter sp. F6033]MCK0128029.1 beta-lactamase family protein [Erythrobacter sp. F6033]
MKMLTLAATGAALASIGLSASAQAQSAQERLDTRYDRALAAGYKALFLCSGIANAERNGTARTPESIHAWELTGIQAPLDDIVRDMPYEIVRRPTGQVAHVQVEWAEDMPDRVAAYYGEDTGCSVLPIGAPEGVSNPELPIEIEAINKAGEDSAFPDGGKVKKRFSETIATAFSTDTYGEGVRSTAAVVLKDGKLIEQRYAEGFGPDTPQRTWSVAKSIAATFVGAAVQSGEFTVDDLVGLNYWRSGGSGDARNAITIDHALRMATGRYSDTPGNRTDPLYWGGTTVDERAANWPVIAKPGTVYRYANNDTLMAVKAVDSWLSFYPPHEFFEKLGMDHTVAETDIRGNYVLSSQVWSTARDLAKLGQLYLNDGMWNGERLLPENWREYVSDPSGPQPEGTQWGYGAGWWTFRRPDGNAFEGIPDDAFAARGNRGQYVVVVPSRNVVIVRRGEDMVGTRFDIAKFTRDVLAAID